MHRYKRAWLLLSFGVAAVAATLLVVSILNREPSPEPRPWLDPALFQESLEAIGRQKLECEGRLMTSISKNRPHFEAIVRAIEKQELAESGRQFAFPKGKSPDSLKRVDQSFDRAELGAFCEANTLVTAERQKGVLFVNVVICELGHAGTYSVLYTSKNLSEEEVEIYISAPVSFARLDPQWWALVVHY
jgi:hypothetical protein